MNSFMDAVRGHFEARNRAWITLDSDELAKGAGTGPDAKWYKSVQRTLRQKYRAYTLQGKKLLRVHSHIRIHQAIPMRDRHTMQVQIEEHIRWVYSDRGALGVEARIIQHRQNWVVHRDRWTLVQASESNERDRLDKEEMLHQPQDAKLPLFAYARVRNGNLYDRVQSTRYAELWWNGFNPEYRSFSDDCTNFISQCLFAGRMPQSGGQTRESGWWYKFGNSNMAEPWSYSWSTSHALAQYLLHHVGAQRLQHARELKMGDLIFYDWDGSGSYRHTTIVTDFDESCEPLVNAHSDPSYHRPYTYLDSRAWTPQTRYLFIHLPDKF